MDKTHIGAEVSLSFALFWSVRHSGQAAGAIRGGEQGDCWGPDRSWGAATEGREGGSLVNLRNWDSQWMGGFYSEGFRI